MKFRRSPRGCALGLLLSLGLFACAAVEPATEVVVSVDSDFQGGTELTQLRVEIMDERGDTRSSTEIPRDTSTKLSFPVSFSLTPSEGATAFTLKVIGLGPASSRSPETELVEQVARASFTPRRRMLLTMFLAKSCLGKVCSPNAEGALLTCKHGSCEPAETSLVLAGPGPLGGYTSIDQQPSPATTDGGKPDGSMQDAGRLDGGRADAGESANTDSGTADAQTPRVECSRSEECQSLIANAMPAGCAIARCVAGLCEFVVADTDKDSVPTKNCITPDVTIALGEDCNDLNPEQKPGAWDGPLVGDLPDSCDDVDNDCNGIPDDGTRDGKSCACDPSVDIDVDCSEQPDGTAIVWPKGVPVGGCSYGKRSCIAGVWGTCVGAKGPGQADSCSVPGDDTNCDGTANAGCACVNGQTQPCGTDRGACEFGMQTCVGGTWSTDCVGGVQPAAKDSCDPGNDANCSGAAGDGCLCLTGETSTCARVQPLFGFGDCPEKPVTCVGGAWDTTPCLAQCNQCDAEGLVLCRNGRCRDGFNDYQCECNTGYTTDATGRACVATPCSPNPCGSGTCVAGSGTTYTCRCNAGFELKAGKCEKIPLCQPGACANGTCVESATDWSCTCKAGFTYDATTKTCVAVSNCPANACAPGTCVSDPGTAYHCVCPAGSMPNAAGTACVAADPCKGVSCPSGSRCVASGASSECRCTDTNAELVANQCVCKADFALCGNTACVPKNVVMNCEACLPECGLDVACVTECVTDMVTGADSSP